MLKHQPEIQEVLSSGKRVPGKFANMFFKTADSAKFAVLVPRRLGNAVHRNKMKRLAREIYRCNPEWFKQQFVIFFMKRYTTDYDALEKDIHQLVMRK